MAASKEISETATVFNNSSLFSNHFVGKLQPLMERIAATNELIDQIVYKLTG